MRGILLLTCVCCFPLTAAGQQVRPRPAVPEVNTEVSQTAGVSIIRQPFSFFGASEGSAGGGEGSYEMRLKRVPLKECFNMTCPLPLPRLYFETELPGGSYNVSVEAESREEAFKKLREACEQAFGLKIVREAREKPVLVLRENGNAEAEPIPALENYRGFPSGSIHNLSFDYRGAMQDFAASLEGHLGKPVVLEADRAGGFHFKIETRPGSRRADLDAWLNQHGLELVEATRAIEGIFVETAKPADATP